MYLSCAMGPKGRVIIASNDHPKTAIDRYAVRWFIETLFGCLKSRGFDLEKTHLRQSGRLEKLFFVLSLALLHKSIFSRSCICIDPCYHR